MIDRKWVVNVILHDKARSASPPPHCRSTAKLLRGKKELNLRGHGEGCTLNIFQFLALPRDIEIFFLLCPQSRRLALSIFLKSGGGIPPNRDFLNSSLG